MNEEDIEKEKVMARVWSRVTPETVSGGYGHWAELTRVVGLLYADYLERMEMG